MYYNIHLRLGMRVLSLCIFSILLRYEFNLWLSGLKKRKK